MAGVEDQNDDALLEAGYILEELETYEDIQEVLIEESEAKEAFVSYVKPERILVEADNLIQNTQFTQPSILNVITVKMLDSDGNIIEGPIAWSSWSKFSKMHIPKSAQIFVPR